MRFGHITSVLPCLATTVSSLPASQTPLLRDHHGSRAVSVKLFAELEELARVVDISYCVGLTGLGISKPFQCLSRCSDFEDFELVKTWNTGPLLSDSCGYVALSHPPSAPRIIVAFRGTYSIANTIADLSTVPQQYVPYPGNDDQPPTSDTSSPDACANCTVHSGFLSSWRNTRSHILPSLEAAITSYPTYQLTVVGHSLGGAVAALASLDFHARGWSPRVTTFGEPRIGNAALMTYIDQRFQTPNNATSSGDLYEMAYHRVTHVDDPVPLLPLKQWGYRMHGGEIFISKPGLPPSVADLQHCLGDADPACIAGVEEGPSGDIATGRNPENEKEASGDGNGYGQHEVTDKGVGTLPPQYKLWQLFFAHRDYFWRLGLCVPGGDPRNWYTKYPHLEDPDRIQNNHHYDNDE
ncbi:hypothetical protein LTR04_007142 [Oleoguttula sp. CCFEE 6159]|nr:hypothetical protein LTR04_007142 [Oleoguttula sp. CCFEE 6159]